MFTPTNKVCLLGFFLSPSYSSQDLILGIRSLFLPLNNDPNMTYSLPGSRFFAFRADSSFEGTLCAGKHIGRYARESPFLKNWQKIKMYPSTLISYHVVWTKLISNTSAKNDQRSLSTK